jgi:uncharacterized membrane protein
MNIAALFGQTTYYDDSYYSTTSDAATNAAAAGLAATMILIMLILVIAVYVITALFMGRIFKKAGIESWKAWVPIYNNWIIYELGEQKGYWAVLALIPVLNIVAAVFMYIAMYNIGLKFSKEGAFVLLAIFLPIVWIIWLAVDSSTWKGGPAIAGAARPKSHADKPDAGTVPPAI